MKVRLAFLYVISIFLTLTIVVLAMYSNQKIEDNLEKKEGEEINFESNQNIQLYRSEIDQIQEINLNYYLLCVVASEMPFKYEYEAIKAQTIVARTYLFNKLLNNNEPKGEVCDSYTHCQAFSDIDRLEEAWRKKGYTQQEIKEGQDKIKRAIVETENMVITYNGQIINALFHASSPEKTEDAKAIWSGEDIPYLKSVDNVENLDYENRNSVVSIPYTIFRNTLIDNGYVYDITNEEFKNICISDYTDSGRVKNISIGPYKVKAEVLRTLFNIKSTNFKLYVSENEITFNVLGFGHGVGMSQVGANTLAENGITYDEIIKFYYTGVEIVNGYDIQKKRG